jgi:hypothetical protein
LPEGDVPTTTEYYDRRMPEKRLLPAGLLLEVDIDTDNTEFHGVVSRPHHLMGFRFAQNAEALGYLTPHGRPQGRAWARRSAQKFLYAGNLNICSVNRPMLLTNVPEKRLNRGSEALIMCLTARWKRGRKYLLGAVTVRDREIYPGCDHPRVCC